MQLTITTNYAIRIIMCLAETRRITPAGEIAEKTKIAKKSLLATANKLKRAKLIAGHKGVLGGYSLARPPENITLLEIMKVTEGTTKISHCLNEKGICPWQGDKNCPLRTFFGKIQGELDRHFSTVTIDDLMTEDIET